MAGEELMKNLLIALAPVLSLALLGFAATTLAQTQPDSPIFLPTPDLPTAPPGINSGEIIEPEVTITRTREQVITEYRIRGRLYMVKIDPLTGPPYFLFDSNGDGILDIQEDRGPNLSVPQWLLFSW